MNQLRKLLIVYAVVVLYGLTIIFVVGLTVVAFALLLSQGTNTEAKLIGGGWLLILSAVVAAVLGAGKP
jgi:hypothetical protein